jgi:hypothetical protein
MTDHPSISLYNRPLSDSHAPGNSRCQPQLTAHNSTKPSDSPNKQIESLYSFREQKNLKECCTLRPTSACLELSRRWKVEKSNLAPLTKKIKKKRFSNLKESKNHLTSKCPSPKTDEDSEEGFEGPERDLDRIIHGNRKLYSSGNFRYHPDDGTLEIVKRLVLKSVEKIQKWLNPIQRIRLFDYEIYSDTTVLLDDLESREWIPTFTVDTFKRILSITHDSNKQTYKYLLEEKVPGEKGIWLGLENFDYLTNFLDSLGNSVAHQVSVSLHNFLDNLHLTTRKLSERFESAVIGKVWIQRLNKATKDFIKSYPY